MEKQLGQKESVMLPGAAKLLLIHTGRAVESGDCLELIDEPDSIGRGLARIYWSGRADTLPSAIAEDTGEPSVQSAPFLGRLAAVGAALYSESMGMLPEEAAASL